jgi:hypothetical protein
MRVDFKELLTFLRAYRGSHTGLTGGQIQRQLDWSMKKVYRIRRFCLEEGLLELDHIAPEEPWHQMTSKHYRLTVKGRRLLEAMNTDP